MIHEIAIWKLVLIGLGVASGSFIIGFVIACVLAASGRASRMEEDIVWACRHGEMKINPPIKLKEVRDETQR